VKLTVGTVVAYPPHGVGRISARNKKVVLGVEEEVVVIELGNELSVTLPVARANELLRPPATEADLKKVQKTLREDGVVSDEIWSKRLQHAQEKLRSGDPIDLAEIVRDGSSAEVAFAVADSHHGRGVGSILASELAADARAAGITQLTATVCGDNPRILALLQRLGSLDMSWRGGERELVVGLEH